MKRMRLLAHVFLCNIFHDQIQSAVPWKCHLLLDLKVGLLSYLSFDFGPIYMMSIEDTSDAGGHLSQKALVL